LDQHWKNWSSYSIEQREYLLLHGTSSCLEASANFYTERVDSIDDLTLAYFWEHLTPEHFESMLFRLSYRKLLKPIHLQGYLQLLPGTIEIKLTLDCYWDEVSFDLLAYVYHLKQTELVDKLLEAPQLSLAHLFREANTQYDLPLIKRLLKHPNAGSLEEQIEEYLIRLCCIPIWRKDAKRLVSLLLSASTVTTEAYYKFILLQYQLSPMAAERCLKLRSFTAEVLAHLPIEDPALQVLLQTYSHRTFYQRIKQRLLRRITRQTVV